MKRNKASSSGSLDHGDIFHKEQEITQSYEDKGPKNELETGGESLNTMPQATKTLETTSTAKLAPQLNYSFNTPLSQEELAEMKRMNPSRYLKSDDEYSEQFEWEVL